MVKCESRGRKSQLKEWEVELERVKAKGRSLNPFFRDRCTICYLRVAPLSHPSPSVVGADWLRGSITGRVTNFSVDHAPFNSLS